MSDTTLSSTANLARQYALPLDMLQRGFLWLLIAVSWFVMVEPSPYELVFAVTFMVFLAHGMSVGRQMIPLIVFLLLYNIGGIISVIPRMDSQFGVQFTVVSCYMAITGLFFAFISAKEPIKVVRAVRSGYIVAAVIASLTGLIGYFGIAGTFELLAPMGRAQGTFKDPNVLGTFLILPAVFIVHGLVTGQQRWKPLAIAALVVILAGNFLAFSRGAWLAMFMSIATAMALTFMVTTSTKLRSRIVLWSVAGAIGIIALLVFALSIHEVSSMFADRAKLVQSYDAGETGRFSRMINSIPTVLQAPNGVGMLPYALEFGEYPHNVYLNAFVAYGWLGGISYLLLVIATLVAGWRAVFTHSPWQQYSIVVVSATFIAILQGVQIDTDHWRHFYLQLGLVWGLYAATETYREGQRPFATTMPSQPDHPTTELIAASVETDHSQLGVRAQIGSTQEPLDHNSPASLRRSITMQIVR